MTTVRSPAVQEANTAPEKVLTSEKLLSEKNRIPVAIMAIEIIAPTNLIRQSDQSILFIFAKDSHIEDQDTPIL